LWAARTDAGAGAARESKPRAASFLDRKLWLVLYLQMMPRQPGRSCFFDVPLHFLLLAHLLLCLYGKALN
jgi:hypothetical protein